MKDSSGNDIVCESEGKICYTEREANETLNSARHHGNRSKKIPVRKYFCKECGYFHLTSHKSEKGGKLHYDLKLSKIIAFEYKKSWRKEYSILLPA